MGEVQYRGDTLIMRPMLALEKAEIVAYAEEEMLQWVEDESNQQNSFDRNFLRNEIIPHLLARWPKLTKTVGRSAELCAEQSALVSDSAQKYFEDCKRTESQARRAKARCIVVTVAGYGHSRVVSSSRPAVALKSADKTKYLLLIVKSKA